MSILVSAILYIILISYIGMFVWSLIVVIGAFAFSVLYLIDIDRDVHSVTFEHPIFSDLKK